jgi:hypothetical protein
MRMHNPTSETGSRDTAMDTDETTHLATRNAVVARFGTADTPRISIKPTVRAEDSNGIS